MWKIIQRDNMQDGLTAKIKLDIDEESLNNAEKEAIVKLEYTLKKHTSSIESVGKQLENALSKMVSSVTDVASEGQEKTATEAKKTTKEVGKSVDGLVKKTKEAGKSFLSLKNIMLSLAGVVVGGGSSMMGLKAMVGTTLELSKGLYEFQRNTGLSTTKLQEWQQAVGRVSGESSETVKNSIMELQKQMELVKRGLAPAGQFQMMGIDVFTEDAFTALDKIYQKAQGLSPLMAKELFGKIGLSEGIVDTLYEPDAFKNLVRVISPDEIKRMEKLRRDTETFKNILKSIKQESVGLALPDLADEMKEFTQYLLQNKDVLREFLTDTIKGMVRLSKGVGYIVAHFANFYVGLKGIYEFLKDNKAFASLLSIIVPVSILVKKMMDAKSVTFGLRDAFKSIMSPLGLVKLGLLALFLIIEDIGTYMRTGGGFTGKLVKWWKEFDFEDFVVKIKDFANKIKGTFVTMFENIFATLTDSLFEKYPFFKTVADWMRKSPSVAGVAPSSLSGFGMLPTDAQKKIVESDKKRMSLPDINVTNNVTNNFNGTVDRGMVSSATKDGIREGMRSATNAQRNTYLQ